MIRPILAAGLLKLHEVKPEGHGAAGGWEDGWSNKNGDFPWDFIVIQWDINGI